MIASSSLPQAQSIQAEASRPTLKAWLLTALVLAVAVLVFVASDRWFPILDDEIAIINVARWPVSETVRLFWFGGGQHEHPPLTDILWHWWLPVGGAAQWSLRLPSILLYLTGLVLLALTAQKMGGAPAFKALLVLGLLWPYGFHFARLAAWYSFCFFLVATLTLTYLRYIERPTGLKLAIFVIAALCLVYSNYYGWAVMFCFAIEAFISGRHKQGGRLMLITFFTLLVAYAPIWTAFAKELLGHPDFSGGSSLLTKLMTAVYNVNAVFVSESVAPWFWYFSVPAFACIATSVLCSATLFSSAKRWFVYFALLFAGMAVLGIVRPNRLLFFSAWLLLAFAVALSNPGKRAARNVLIVTLAGISAIGWTGIIARRYYAAPHFIEPWAEIADKAALAQRQGALIIGNNSAFFFDLHYSLQRLGSVPRSALPGWTDYPGVVRVEKWDETPHSNRSSILFVRGVNNSLIDQTEEVERWLRSNCVSRSQQPLVPDSGAALKARFYKGKGQQQPPFRISVQWFDCSSGSGT